MGPDADPGGPQMVAEPVGAPVELLVGQSDRPGHQGQPIGEGVRHHLEQIGQVELSGTHGPTPLLGSDCPAPGLVACCFEPTVCTSSPGSGARPATVRDKEQGMVMNRSDGAGGVAGLAALVTGGGSGIGLGAATRLVRDGAHVTICGRTEDKLRAAVEGLDRVVAEAAAAGGPAGSATYVVADVTVEEQIAGAVAQAAEPRGRLDILFANAGGSMHMGPITEADAGQVRATVDVNLIGTFLSIKHGAPLMAAGVGAGVDGGVAPGGSIIGMSSGAGHFPHRYLWAYGAAKAGIDMLCRVRGGRARRHGGAGQLVAARHRGRRAHGPDQRRWPAARRLPGRDAGQSPGHGGGDRRRRPLSGRAGIHLDHRGQPAHRRRPPPAAGGQLRPAVRSLIPPVGPGSGERGRRRRGSTLGADER